MRNGKFFPMTGFCLAGLLSMMLVLSVPVSYAVDASVVSPQDRVDALVAELDEAVDLRDEQRDQVRELLRDELDRTGEAEVWTWGPENAELNQRVETILDDDQRTEFRAFVEHGEMEREMPEQDEPVTPDEPGAPQDPGPEEPGTPQDPGPQDPETPQDDDGPQY